MEKSAAAWWSEVGRLAPTFKLPKGGSHYAEGAIKNTLQTKGYKVFGTVMSDADFYVTKNGLGVPIKRSREG